MVADAAGWDGVFVWEAAYGVDAWSLLAAMAEGTTRVRLGTMLTPLPWRRPWKVASQALTLDLLSEGRAILAVGLGAADTGLGTFGEITDRRARAELLDEGIDLITSLWAGEKTHEGRHHQIDLTTRVESVEAPRPVQRPRIPIWAVGAWPRPASMRRILRCDGILPNCMGEDGIRDPTPEDIVDLVAWLDANGGRRPGFDVVMEGETPADDPAAAADVVRPWAEAGCTWWLDARWEVDAGERRRAVHERLEAGPPRLGPR